MEFKDNFANNSFLDNSGESKGEHIPGAFSNNEEDNLVSWYAANISNPQSNQNDDGIFGHENHQDHLARNLFLGSILVYALSAIRKNDLSPEMGTKLNESVENSKRAWPFFLLIWCIIIIVLFIVLIK